MFHSKLTVNVLARYFSEHEKLFFICLTKQFFVQSFLQAIKMGFLMITKKQAAQKNVYF